MVTSRTELLSYLTDADAAAEVVDEIQKHSAAGKERWSVPVADALELLLLWSQSVGQMRLSILNPAGRYPVVSRRSAAGTALA